LNWVGPDYFHTMEIPVLRGRDFSQSDRRDSPEVLVVNKTFADRYWPGQDALGKHVKFSTESYEVVGVVANSKFRKLQEPEAPFLYLSTTWNYTPQMVIQARTASDPMVLAAALRQTVQRIDPKLPMYAVMTLDEATDGAAFQQELSAWLLGAFGVLALVLACVGVYGSMAYAVSRRTRELGVRMALGASRSGILLLILKNGMRITAAGLAVGTLLAIAAGRVLSNLLFQVRPIDPVVFSGVFVVLVCVSLLAGYVPARRAARLDPLEALRCE
jgi:predicted permease